MYTDNIDKIRSVEGEQDRKVLQLGYWAVNWQMRFNVGKMQILASGGYTQH